MTARTSPAKEFGDVFLQELHAVAARRRRYRIDRVFGELPKVPQPLPPWSAPADPAIRETVVAPSAVETPEDLDELIGRLEVWYADVSGWREHAHALGTALRRHSWSDMAKQIIEVAEST